MDNSVLKLQQELKELLINNGADDVGFCALEERDIQMLDDDGLGIGDCKYGLSIVIRLSDAVVDEIQGEPTHTYFHHYRTVNAFIDRTLLLAGKFLERHGYKYIPVGASQSINKNGWNYHGRFSHKHLACHCGLGTVGKSSLFLHNTYGPRVRLGSLFTDCPFPQEPVVPESVCGECRICTNACPAGAISGKEWYAGVEREEIFAPDKCSNHMKRAYQHIGRGAVCGICMQVCPRGKRK